MSNNGKEQLGYFDHRFGDEEAIVFPNPHYNIARLVLPYRRGATIAHHQAYASGIIPPSELARFLNCQAFVWLVYKEIFGFPFSSDLLSKEIWEGKDGWFVPVGKGQMQKIGDIYFFKPWPVVRDGKLVVDPENAMDYHLAVGTGDFDNGIPRIAHACYTKGAVSIERLTDLTRQIDGHKSRYQEFIGIRRLTDEDNLWKIFLGRHVGNCLYIEN